MSLPKVPPSPLPEPGPGRPTSPIPLSGHEARGFGRAAVNVPDEVVELLRATGAEVVVDLQERAEESRDWWPLAMTWALDGRVGQVAGAVCRVSSVEQVAAMVSACNDSGIPVTTAAGRSGVLGGSVPVFGGVLLDVCGLSGIVDVDSDSMVVTVRAGTFGDVLETELRTRHGLTLGHWPQSMSLSTVGGWLACRSAGQMSNRYGKIEDMVVGVTVVLADGSVVTTGQPGRTATGPDLTQVFVGSEGTLGVITEARLRVHRAPAAEVRAAWGFESFGAGLDACRRIVQRGATPAVLRLYDAVESDRHFSTGARHVLLMLDEGDPTVIDATAAVCVQECQGEERLDDGLVEQWMQRRNDVAALEALISKGYVVDTMEITSPWAAIDEVYEAATAAIAAVDGALVASAHQSHAYTDAACLYFTFAGQPLPGARDAFYVACWDAGTRAVLEHGGSLSHHHGVGLNRGRFMRQALGSGFDVLERIKSCLDPNGILNPGKLGLTSQFGSPRLPY